MNMRGIAAGMAATALTMAGVLYMTAPVAARSCQEQCDAQRDSMAAYCNATYTFNSPEWLDCWNENEYQWWLCSTGAYWCGSYFECEFIGWVEDTPAWNCVYD